MSNPAAECTAAVLATLQSIAGIGTKAFLVKSDEELMDKIKGMTTPAAGVIYEGLRSRGEQQSSHKIGLAADLGITILIFFEGRAPLGRPAVKENAALQLLDDVRNKIRDTQAPTGKFWQFVMEAQALEKHGVVVWVQRWSTPVLLTQGL